MPEEYIEITASGPLVRKDEAAALLLWAGSPGVQEGETDGGGAVALTAYYLKAEGAGVVPRLMKKLGRLGWSGEAADYRDLDWTELWKRWARPVRVAGVFVVRPTWCVGGPGDRGRKVIEIDPGMAFGTGSHETTKLCLKALASLYKGGYKVGKNKVGKNKCGSGAPLKGRVVLDVGCGTGVLAIGAGKLGARRVVAIDTDPVAVKVARKNVRLNGGGVVVSSKGLNHIKGSFSVVVANIISGELMRLRDELVKKVGVGGQLILSGILAGEAGEVIGAFTGGGELSHLNTYKGGAWVEPVFIKTGPKVGRGPRREGSSLMNLWPVHRWPS